MNYKQIVEQFNNIRDKYILYDVERREYIQLTYIKYSVFTETYEIIGNIINKVYPETTYKNYKPTIHIMFYYIDIMALYDNKNKCFNLINKDFYDILYR